MKVRNHICQLSCFSLTVSVEVTICNRICYRNSVAGQTVWECPPELQAQIFGSHRIVLVVHYRIVLF